MTTAAPTLLERQLEASVREVQGQKMTQAIVRNDSAPTALARPEEQGIPIEMLVARVHKVREVQARVMQEGRHYGNVPGTDKPALLKPGAELLGLTFQLAPEFKSDERWEGEHLEAVITCKLRHAPTGALLGEGIGSCSTREKKYAWRSGGRKCPTCGKEGSLFRSKDKPEWFCWRKKDGCGATFPANDEKILSQKEGRVPNPDLADTYNTVRKMACKRAHVAAILFVTCASEIFTQDVEDNAEPAEPGHGHGGYSGHAAPDEDRDAPPKESPEFGALMAKLHEADRAVFDPACTWETMTCWRAELGSKGTRTPFGARLSTLYQSDAISPGQRRELGALSNRVDRKLTQLEVRLKPPAVEASFIDPPDGELAEREPGAEG